MAVGFGVGPGRSAYCIRRVLGVVVGFVVLVEVDAVLLEQGLDATLEPFDVVAGFGDGADDRGDVFFGSLGPRFESADAGLKIGERGGHR